MKKYHIYGLLIIIAIAMAIVAYKSERSAQTPSFAKRTKTTQAVSSKNYFAIPEVELRMELDITALPDLIYGFSVPAKSKTISPATLNFSAATLETLAEEYQDMGALKNCIVTNGPLGSVSIFRKYPNDGEPALPAETQIAGKVYVQFNDPKPCATNPELQLAITTKAVALKEMFQTLQTPGGKVIRQLEQGILEGSIIPPAGVSVSQLQVCAVNVATKESFCNGSKRVTDKKFIKGVGYRLTVPAGSYSVYATTARNPRDPNAYRAYYTEFVTCGDLKTCTDHTTITVDAINNFIQSNIDPTDWNNIGDKELLKSLIRKPSIRK